MAYFKSSTKPNFLKIITLQPHKDNTVCFTDQVLINNFSNVDNYQISELITWKEEPRVNSFVIPRNNYTVATLFDYLNSKLRYLTYGLEKSNTDYKGKVKIKCKYNLNVTIRIDSKLSFLMGLINIKNLKENINNFVTSEFKYSEHEIITFFDLISHLYCLSIHASFLKYEDKLSYLYITDHNIEVPTYLLPQTQKEVDVNCDNIGML